MSKYNKLLKVKLTIHKPSASRRLTEVNEIVKSQTNADASAIKSSINLFQKGDTGQFNAVLSQARCWFTDNSLAWDEKSWRAIPADKWIEFSDKIRKFSDTAKEIFQDDVLGRYDQLKRNFEFSKGTLDVEFPSEAEIEEHFSIDLSCEPVATNVNGLILNGLKNEIVKDVESQIRKQNEESLSKGLVALSTKLIGMLEDLKIRLGTDQKGKSYKKLFGNLRDISTIAGDLNISNNNNLTDAVSLIQLDILWYNPDNLREQDAIRATMGSSVGDIVDLLREVR